MSKRGPDAEEIACLLTAVADAFNACEQAGLKIKLRHGAVMTPGGFVLPTEGPWVARSLVYTEFDFTGYTDDLDS